MSLDAGPSILAPWSTKVGALAKLKSETTYLDLSNIDEGVCSPFDVETLSPASAVDNLDASWRSGIDVGTILDARDLQSVWYQVGPQHQHALSDLIYLSPLLLLLPLPQL